MIKEIRLEDWKSFESSTLYIDPLTVLIGTNASGKSNALDALLFLMRTASGAALSAALQGDAYIDGVRGGLEWVCRKPKSAFAIEALISGADERTDYHYRLEAEVYDNHCQLRSERLKRIRYRLRTTKNPYEISLFWSDPCGADEPSITARLYNEKRGTPRPFTRMMSVLSQLQPQAEAGAGVRKEISEGVVAVTRTLKNIFILDPIPSHMRGFAQLSEQLEPDASNIAGVIAALPDDKRQEMEQTLTEYVRHLPERDICKVFAEPVGRFKTDAMLYCEEQWTEGEDSTTVDARGMSDGTLRFLAIVTALLTRPKGSLLVVEEIDNGLHPSRADLLLKVLRDVGRARQIDVLVTTHNPALLDELGPEMMSFITVSHREADTGYSRLTLLEDIRQLPKLLAWGTVGKLSSQGHIEKALKMQGA
ncbi:AAA family ATPase [Candidatus Entotheonella palauensis]|uniref:Uncharacterized protein n=1 Tax=Candidatus Entotheonella gemina TaxID=1429439 RepID=W4MFX4_9BACT|nr:ATP-binding protein [Candidatus Entotheonella palauensis]ETX09095.1 MAG: hypothetical protein ETSY2_01530 [Candidatus Entotheonella gemina]